MFMICNGHLPATLPVGMALEGGELEAGSGSRKLRHGPPVMWPKKE